MARRRLLEPAFVDGQMREAGYEFEDDSAGPHRRNPDDPFAYHPQFVNIPPMSALDRIKAKALEARSVAPDEMKAFESDLDGLIAEREKLQAARAGAVSKHTGMFKGIREQFDGLHSAIDILSNGDPDPLPASADAPKV